MKTLFVALVLVLSQMIAVGQDQQEYYQLKKYTINSEYQEKIVDDFLEKAYLPALHRLGIENIGVFKPVENKSDSLTHIYVLIPFSTLDQYAELDSKLASDAKFQKDGSGYLELPNENPAYERMESTLLIAFEDMPQMRKPDFATERKSRVYELRSYESATEKLGENKVDMFNAGGEITLFENLGFNAVFYGKVISGSSMPNLMYMTTFSDKESRDAHWKQFVESPVWIKMKSLPKYDIGNVSHIDIHFLYPTEYSDY